MPSRTFNPLSMHSLEDSDSRVQARLSDVITTFLDTQPQGSSGLLQIQGSSDSQSCTVALLSQSCLPENTELPGSSFPNQRVSQPIQRSTVARVIEPGVTMILD